ncbi:MAG TPA: helix-turn-helix transcriptional regulator [Verrucomicrobiae bacterium]|nr:helix-turn-helix transcriptional regulator [Verrucomicrobiae bacterium]
MHEAQKTAVNGSPAATSESPSLSRREAEVFQLLGCGYGPSQTAEELKLSVKTVEGYLGRIKKKLRISDARTLRQYAIQQGRASKKPSYIGDSL